MPKGPTVRIVINKRSNAEPMSRCRRASLQQLFADRVGIRPGTILIGRGIALVALRQKLIECVGGTHLLLNDQATVLHADIDFGPDAEFQEVEKGRGHGQHDGTADLAQGRSMHGHLHCYT